MHEKNIIALKKEAMVLLDESVCLLSNAVTKAEADQERERFLHSMGMLKEEAFKLRKNEIVIAVVGTMKAGKSTTINAIVGSEVLPVRNLPMTTLPTLLRHVPGKKEPELSFPGYGHVVVFGKRLRKALREAGEHRGESIRRRNDFRDVLHSLESAKDFSGKRVGRSAVFDLLKELNDLVRLGDELNTPFPFEKFASLKDFPCVEMEFRHLRDCRKNQGNLCLLDTPGPNEAERDYLHGVMKAQLERASAVIAVLDYTQIGSEADEQVRRHLLENTESMEGRIFVLLNKFDQKDRHSSDEQETKARIVRMMNGLIDERSIFPVSAQRAYLSNRAKDEVLRNGGLSTPKPYLEETPEMCGQYEWIEDFGEEAFGYCWEKMIGNADEVREAAEDLWEASLFQAALEKTIRRALAQSPLLALESAATTLLLKAERFAAARAEARSVAEQSRLLHRRVKAIRRDIRMVADGRRDTARSMKELSAHLDSLVFEEMGSAARRARELLEERLTHAKREGEKVIALRRIEERRRAEEAAEKPVAKMLEALRRLRGNALFAEMLPPEPSGTICFESAEDFRRFGENAEEIVRDTVLGGCRRIDEGAREALSGFEEKFSLSTAILADERVRDAFSDFGRECARPTFTVPPLDRLESVPEGGFLRHALQKRSKRETAFPVREAWWGRALNRLYDKWGREPFEYEKVWGEADPEKVLSDAEQEIENCGERVRAMLKERVTERTNEAVSAFLESLTHTLETLRTLPGAEDADETIAAENYDAMMKETKDAPVTPSIPCPVSTARNTRRTGERSNAGLAGEYPDDEGGVRMNEVMNAVSVIGVREAVPTARVEVLKDEGIRLLELTASLLEGLEKEKGLLGEEKEKGTYDCKSVANYRGILDEERRKLRDLELVIAVIGTMKAGKSTTINAIVGNEVLPNRNRPMTTLPTLIRHVPGKTEPELSFPGYKHVAAFKNDLRSAFALVCEEKKATILSNNDYEDVLKDLEESADGSGLQRGADGVFSFLKDLNDLVRLGDELDVSFPYGKFESVADFPCIEVEFFHLRDSGDAQGTLCILDTPGPNEAGKAAYLPDVMRKQLEKASAVLAVVDYTQIGSDADKEVRDSLAAVAKAAKGRIFVLSNKFDQKNEHGSGPEETKTHLLRLMSECEIKVTDDDIFPVSAQRAYLANRAKREIETNGKLPKSESGEGWEAWVKDFAGVAFGLRWKKAVDDSDEVLELAEETWNESLFQAPLDKVILHAHAHAAVLALDSAASKLKGEAERMQNFTEVRLTTLKQNLETLRNELKKLENDKEKIINEQDEAVKRIKKITETLKEEIKESAENTLKEVSRSVEDLFKSASESLTKEREEQEEREKKKKEQKIVPVIKNFWREFLGGNASGENDEAKKFSKGLSDASKAVLEYEKEEEARKMLAEVEKTLRRILQETEKVINESVKETAEAFNQDFRTKIERRVEDIIAEMLDHLKGADFDIPSLTPPSVAKVSIAGSRSLQLEVVDTINRTEKKSRVRDSLWAGFINWFNDDWGREEYTVEKRYFNVDKKRLKEKMINTVNSYKEEMFRLLEKKAATPMSEGVGEFFRDFRRIVEQIQGDIRTGMEDKKKSSAEQGEIARKLEDLRKRIPSEDIDGLEKDVKSLLSQSSEVA